MSVPPEEQCTTSVTVGELLYGAHRLGEAGGRLLTAIEEVLLEHLHVLAFDEAAARRYGRLRADLEAAGTPIGDADLRIAAIALSRQLTVVTGNRRHFQRVPVLSVENWLV